MAEAVVSYKFVATGADSVKAAFKSIDIVAKASLKSIEKDFAKTSTAADKAGARIVESITGSFKKSQKQIETIQSRGLTSWKNYFERVKTMSRQAGRDAATGLGGAARAPRAGKGVGGVALGLGSAAGGAALGAASGALAGLVGVGALVSNAIDAQKEAAKISAMTGGTDANLISQAVRSAVFANKGTDMASGFESLKTLIDNLGDFKMAQEILPVALQAQMAYGTAPSDTAKVAGQLKAAGLDGKQIVDTLATIAKQGEVGQVPLEEFINGFGKLIAGGRGLGVVKAGGKGIGEVAGLYQFAAPLMGSAEEAVTAMADFMARVKPAAGKLGIGLTNAKGETKSLTDLSLTTALSLVRKSGSVQNASVLGTQMFGESGGRFIGKILADLVGKTGKEAGQVGIKDLEAVVGSLREEMDKLTGVTSNQKAMADSAAIAGNTLSGSLTTLVQILSDSVGKPIVGLFDSIGASLKPLAGTGDSLTKAFNFVLNSIKPLVAFMSLGVNLFISIIGALWEALKKIPILGGYLQDMENLGGNFVGIVSDSKNADALVERINKLNQDMYGKLEDPVVADESVDAIKRAVAEGAKAGVMAAGKGGGDVRGPGPWRD